VRRTLEKREGGIRPGEKTSDVESAKVDGIENRNAISSDSPKM
jgi:hypothetical protein